MNKIDIAIENLLNPGQLTENMILSLINNALKSKIDFADFYFQKTYHESWILEDGFVKDGSFTIDKGVGIRVIDNDKTGFAYTNNIEINAISEAIKAATSITNIKQNHSINKLTHSNGRDDCYLPHNPIKKFNTNEKIKILETIDTIARKEPLVKRVDASLSGTYEIVLIINNDGLCLTDIRPLVRIGVNVITESNGRIEKGTSGGGGRYLYEDLLDQNLPAKFAQDAVNQAIVNLQSVEAPAGIMPVVLGSGWPGILLHEAIGHGLEGDFNRKGVSAFTGRIGEKVASSEVTIVDNGTLPGRRGSLNIDDEGVKTQNTVLIENGVLKNYMLDKLNAKLLGKQSTGNGRRESYAYVPIPRMTNTYMLKGKYDNKEIISSVKNGIYAVNFGGGQVDITSGKFVFSINEGYLIKDGKISTPIKGATLIGNGPEILKEISMIGNDLQLDSGVGVCGKDGQNIPVGVGQPTLKINNIVVGGTKGL